MMQTLRSAWVLRALIVAVFALRAAIPVGYMVVSGGDGATVVLCSAQGALTASVDPTTGAVSFAKKAPGKPAGHDEPPCTFSGLAKVAEQVSFIEVPAPAEAMARPSPAAASVAPGRGLSAPPPPATGPPSFFS